LVCRNDKEKVVTIIDGLVLPPTTIVKHEKVRVGLPRRPTDMSLLQSYVNHVTCKLWEGKVRGKLKLFSRRCKLSKFLIPHPKIETIVLNTELLPLWMLVMRPLIEVSYQSLFCGDTVTPTVSPPCWWDDHHSRICVQIVASPW